MNNQPIGVFDSGIGGLTVAHAIKKILPNEDIIYFGDTEHLPYGEKSKKAIKNYSIKITQFLLHKKCKIISRASDESSYSKLKIAGANNVIMPDKLGGDHMASLVVTPDVIEFVDRLTIEGETTANLEEI